MAPGNSSKKQASAWFRRFAAAGPLQKLGMLGNAAFNLAGNLVDEGIEQASHLLNRAQDAFLEGYDDSVDDATIIEEKASTEARKKMNQDAANS